MAPQAKYSFTVKSCRAMAEKMSRELSRFAEASRSIQDPAIVSDHAINFAWTAWHLRDWVWRLHFDGDEAAQDALVLKTDPLRTEKDAENLIGRDGPKRWFVNFLRKECAQLAYCQDIANGTKHVEITHYTPEVKHTTFSASFVQPAMSQFSSGTPTENGLIPPPEGVAPNQRAKIIVGDDRLSAIEVFEAVGYFWGRFLEEHNIS